MPTYRDELNKQLAQEIAAIDEQLYPDLGDVLANAQAAGAASALPEAATAAAGPDEPTPPARSRARRSAKPPKRDVAEDVRDVAEELRKVVEPVRPRAPKAAPAQPQLAYAMLQRRRAFLADMQRQLRSDPELLSFVDAMIGNQVKAAERRQRMVAAGVSLASLIAGWLLSAISPVSALAHLLAR